MTDLAQNQTAAYENSKTMFFHSDRDIRSDRSHLLYKR